MSPRPVKVVVTGPFDAGKTTFVNAAAHGRVVRTERHGVDGQTTVAMDFGRIPLDGVVVQLIGTPGQARFEFMRDILAEGMEGYVLLLAADQDLEEVRPITEQFDAYGVPRVIAVNRSDGADLTELCARLGEDVLDVDARDAASVRRVVAVLLERCPSELAHRAARLLRDSG